MPLNILATMQSSFVTDKKIVKKKLLLRLDCQEETVASSVSTEAQPIEQEEVAGEVNESVNAVAISVEDEESVTGITGTRGINAGEKWPKCWTEQQVKDFTNKYSWLYSKNNCWGCTTCRAAKLAPGHMSMECLSLCNGAMPLCSPMVIAVLRS